MRLALLLGRVPSDDECSRSPFDGPALVELSREHDLVVTVDEDSPAIVQVREAGIPVHVSDKRHVHLPGGREADADEVHREWLETAHAEAPFDVIVADSARSPTHLRSGRLGEVAWGLALATGPTAHARRLARDGAWLREHGHDLWLAASRAATSDVLIGGATARAHTLGASVRVPVRRLSRPRDPSLVERVTGRHVVVVATGVSEAEAGNLVARALARVDVDARTTVFVVCPPPLPGAADLEGAIAAGIPVNLSRQVVLVPSGVDAIAGGLTATADALVVVDATELSIPAVERRAEQVPTALLGDADEVVEDVLTPVASRSRPDPAHHGLLRWTDAPHVRRQLQAMMADPRLDAVVLHGDGAADTATTWLDLDDVGSADVVLGARPRPPWSLPATDRVHADVLALHRRTWAAVVRVLQDVGDLSDLVATTANLPGMTTHTLAVVADDRPGAPTVPPGADRALPGDHGPLPVAMIGPPPAQPVVERVPPADTGVAAPARAGTPASDLADLRSWAKSQRWATRARLALPWRLGLGDAVSSGTLPDGVVAWVRDHRITDRARLVLPWKWGLLPRAMEDLW